MDQIKQKSKINFENFFLILFLIAIFMPKIDLVKIPGYWQGIRLEDIALLTYAVTIIFLYREKIINNHLVQKFSPLLFYFLIFFIGSFVGIISEIPIKYLSLLRVIEYFALVVLLCNLSISKKNFLIYIKLYVLITIVVVILQKLDLFGSFTSLGYLSPENHLNSRIMGLTGGSWEVGVVCTLCYFILITLEKPNLTKIFIYFCITAYINLEGQSRINFLGFMLANIFFLKNYIQKGKYLILIILLFSSIAGAIILKDFLDIDAFDRLVSTDYLQSLVMVKNFLLTLQLPERDSLDFTLWSLWYRLNLWQQLIPFYLDNIFTILFGYGPYAIYYESTILRVILTTGILGFIYVVFMARKLEIFILVYFITIGFTLDTFNSFKIFAFTILYFRLIYENDSYRRN
tara:strand:+ start:1096 stop:2304 length:1209 start_codon:yes stop_codon:yes gene_type:complete